MRLQTRLRAFLVPVGLLTFAGFAVSSAAADVVAIDPFSGDQFEGFESIQPAGPYMGQMPIFSGAATFDDEFTDPWITFSLSGPGGDLTP